MCNPYIALLNLKSGTLCCAEKSVEITYRRDLMDIIYQYQLPPGVFHCKDANLFRTDSQVTFASPGDREETVGRNEQILVDTVVNVSGRVRLMSAGQNGEMRGDETRRRDAKMRCVTEQRADEQSERES